VAAEIAGDGLADGKAWTEGGAARYAANRSATGPSARQTDRGETAENFRKLLIPEPVQLDTAARRQVQPPVAEHLGDVAHRLDLRAREHPGGHFDAKHEVSLVVLLIDAVKTQFLIVDTHGVHS